MAEYSRASLAGDDQSNTDILMVPPTLKVEYAKGSHPVITAANNSMYAVANMLQAVRGLRCSLYQLQKAIKEDLASHVSLQRSVVRRDVANVEAGFVFNGT